MMLSLKDLERFGPCQTDVSFKNLTSFKIGGMIDYVCEPVGLAQCIALIEYLNKHSIAYKVLGNGSNLLASDQPFHGIVIRLREGFNHIDYQDKWIEVDAGVSLINLANQSARLGYLGLEFLSGIPGSVGGALFMNAGAYQKCIYDLVDSVYVYKDQHCVWMKREELTYAYRHSSFMSHPDWLILKVRLFCEKGDALESQRIIKERLERRLASQPLDKPSAGSVFRNPENKAAWALIEESGLRGYQIGDAQISLKHANFIVNCGHAKAEDVRSLIQKIQVEVKKQSGYDLKPEIEFFNF